MWGFEGRGPPAPGLADAGVGVAAGRGASMAAGTGSCRPLGFVFRRQVIMVAPSVRFWPGWAA